MTDPSRRRRPPESATDSVTPDEVVDHGAMAASDDAHRALADQRAEHQPDDVDVDESGIGAIVNNTGLDGEAASG